MNSLTSIGEGAKIAADFIVELSPALKNGLLMSAAQELKNLSDCILKENQKDVENAIKSGITGALIDRLALNTSRIDAMVDGMQQIASLEDPTGEIISSRRLENGLIVSQRRVPLGVIGIIYEARPNVTADAFSLCFKAGSATILRGGKEAINSNKAIIKAFKQALLKHDMPENCVTLIEDTSRETAQKFMKLNKYVDVLIPRGGAGLIQSVIENSTIPVIETGVGNCHIFVDETANFQSALDIIINAKTQRPGVCNACEKVLIHENIAETFLPKLVKSLSSQNVQIRGCEKVMKIAQTAVLATEEDWACEYLDYIIAIKIVENFDSAVAHIKKYSSKHSDAILTESYTNSQSFVNKIDSACVYVNASTRFTDGFEFGFGAEIGISTQKLHARGPMGLKELTSTKYTIFGSGQVRI